MSNISITIGKDSSIADTRDPDSLTDRLVAAGWLSHSLPCGDYRLGAGMEANPLVERKTLKDLLSSIEDGRLMSQVLRMVAATAFPILLIEGHWLMRDNVHLLDTRWTWQQVWHELLTVQDMGMRLYLTTSQEQTFQELLGMVEYYKKEEHESAARGLAGDERVIFLSRCRGIGSVKAKKLIESLGNPSIRDLANLEIPEIKKADGLGEKLSAQLYNWLNKK